MPCRSVRGEPVVTIARLISAASLVILFPFGAGYAWSQTPAPLAPQQDLDRLERPALIEEEASDLQLPPVDRVTERPGELRDQVEFQLIAIDVTGATILQKEEIEALTNAYLNRPITLLDVQELSDAITTLYVQRGFLNSGARIPDQDIGAGRLRIEVIEGVLGAIWVTGATELGEAYVADRLKAGLRSPLNLFALQDNFQLLAEDDNIAEIDARIVPGSDPGVADLEVSVREQKPWRVAFSLGSERSPQTGGDRAGVDIEWRSAFVPGDRILAGGGLGEGFNDVRLEYAAPLNARDWLILLGYDRVEAEVVERPLEALEVETDAETVRVDMIAPVHRRFGENLSLGVGLERRVTRTALFGQPFSFLPEAQNGETEIVFARLSQSYLRRGRHQALALQSTVNIGLDATEGQPAAGRPDTHFLLWLGQARVLRRLTPQHQLNLELDAQIGDGRQFSSMRYSLGGMDNVRGYRRGAVIGDDAVRASVELESRLPSQIGDVALPPLRSRLFVDAGRIWIADQEPGAPDTLAAVGVEIEWRVTEQVQFLAYAAARFGDRISPGERGLQDEGFGYRVRARF